jgi:hypothetical protein
MTAYKTGSKILKKIKKNQKFFFFFLNLQFSFFYIALARLSSRLVCTVLNIEKQLSLDIGKFSEKIGVAF